MTDKDKMKMKKWGVQREREKAGIEWELPDRAKRMNSGLVTESTIEERKIKDG